MSQSEYQDIFGQEPEGTSEPQGPAELRAAYDKMKAEATKLREQLSARDALERSRRVDQFLQEKNLPTEAKSLIGDADPEEWYTQYSKVFGTKPEPEEAEPEAEPETTAPTGTSALTDEQQAAIAAVTGTEALPFAADDIASRDAYLDAATSLQDFEERLARVNLLQKR